ncbi:cyclic nucleotide-binding domain-containing protein [Paraburkholderia tuberum]|uniref:Sulfate permease, SulP family n=1 Tax=Paraburkholderia tuberum TaxID=157910 RepID=A0A1H1JJE0_9BURK|nr:cyclic nucleotide-binding domain-containing protein [Paraburkholderia tuberum]SDR50084.1 sulfate permease, SulP family [Paraburkholderia tuberum]
MVEDQLLTANSRATGHGYDFHAMLAHFTASALSTLLACLEVHDLLAGQVLFLRGEQADALYFIERGRVEVSFALDDGRSVRLRSFGPGTVVGEMAVYTLQQRSADVIAETPTRVRRLSTTPLMGLEQQDPAAAQQSHRFLVKIIAARLAVVDEALRAAL